MRVAKARCMQRRRVPVSLPVVYLDSTVVVVIVVVVVVIIIVVVAIVAVTTMPSPAQLKRVQLCQRAQPYNVAGVKWRSCGEVQRHYAQLVVAPRC